MFRIVTFLLFVCSAASEDASVGTCYSEVDCKGLEKQSQYHICVQNNEVFAAYSYKDPDDDSVCLNLGTCHTDSSCSSVEVIESGFTSMSQDYCAGNAGGASWLILAGVPADDCDSFGSCYSDGSCTTTLATPLQADFSSIEVCEENLGQSWKDPLTGKCLDIDDASAGQDPHFTTFRGNKFDYHGECDLVLVHNPMFANETGLDVHIRTTRFNFFSFVESVAIKIGNETLEINNKAEFRIGDIVYSSERNKYPTHFAGYAVTHDVTLKQSKEIHVFHLMFDSNNYRHHDSIKIHIWDMFLGVFVSHGDAESLFEGSSGMMGDFVGGEMISRDGTSMALTSISAFAAEWQVRSDGTDPVLFHDVRAPTYPQACFLPEHTEREFISPAMRRAAEMACAKWGEGGMANCVYDVIATGNIDIADAEVY